MYFKQLIRDNAHLIIEFSIQAQEEVKYTLDETNLEEEMEEM